jgi:hypothetical protein
VGRRRVPGMRKWSVHGPREPGQGGVYAPIVRLPRFLSGQKAIPPPSGTEAWPPWRQPSHWTAEPGPLSAGTRIRSPPPPDRVQLTPEVGDDLDAREKKP